MALSQTPSRSISLPSRLNPISSSEFELELQKLKSFPIVSSEAIQTSLLGLAKLYNYVQQLAQSSSTHLTVEKALEGSIELLDSCNTIRELFQMIKESVQTLQLALRRKGLDSSIQSDVATYACSRKRMSKCISKTLKTLKALEHKNNGSSNNCDHSSVLLREVSGLTIAIFKGILVFLSCPTMKTGSGWNLVSKLMVSKSVACGRDHGRNYSEMSSVDFALNTLQGRIKNNNNSSVLDLQMVQKRLQNVDCCIEGFEGGLERLFRQLFKLELLFLTFLPNIEIYRLIFSMSEILYTLDR